MSDDAKIKWVREMRDLARRTCLNRIDVRTVDLTAIVDENDRLRARVAELEEKLAEAEQDAANVREVSAVVRAEDYEEIEQLRARVAELEEQVKEAVVRLARVPDMLDRERREGAEAMRERIAKHLDKRARQNVEAADRQQARADAFDSAADDVREMVLDDDARDDAQGGE